jgi:cytochrome b pre-mRNA-processing protein 3
VKLSRNIYFYKNLKLDDNFETRIILIFLHFSLILNIFKNKKIKFPQEIFDNIFQNVEYNMRELGHGDVSVNSKMKLLNKIFYDILLKIENSQDNCFKVDKNTLIKHLSDNKKFNVEYTAKLTTYLESFYNFCFELDTNIMIKGQINFNN